ncbi:DNA polymerase III subunit delta [Desulfolucanica intricata]|uniref:DNA polymerase III subunit delta n=1 Tax=Desulfolucanica intricata TaxID=1285191 RepID=UPI00082C4349|nr:DNA polymerase III subunit delta [Desulfolucanica intricata]
MKYFLDFLDKLHKGDIKPVYLFYGEEVYLQNEAVNRLKEAVLAQETQDFNFDLLNGEEAAPGDIISLAQNPPFMAEKRLVVVKNFTALGSPPKDQKEQKTVKEDVGKYKALIEYIEKPVSTTILVFTFPSAVDRRKKLVQLINKTGEMTEFTLLNKRDAGRWLMKQAKLAGKKFESGALEALLGVTKTNLNRLSNEINKVINFTGERAVITQEDVVRVAVPQVELNIFDVVDAIGEKRCIDALRSINELLLYREPPQRILAMIYRQFRLLLQFKKLQEEGVTLAEVQARLKLHPFVVKKLSKQVENYTVNELHRSLADLLVIDVAIKSGRGEFYPAVANMLVKMCI